MLTVVPKADLGDVGKMSADDVLWAPEFVEGYRPGA
jgi:hypothetical protein